MGCWYNCTQVFGENLCCWGVPIQEEPLRGKGYVWDKNTQPPRHTDEL